MGEKGTWFRITSAGLRDSSGNLFGAMETLEDITEQKWLRNELLQRTKLESLGHIRRRRGQGFWQSPLRDSTQCFMAKISAVDEDKIMEDGLAVAERAGLQAKELAHDWLHLLRVFILFANWKIWDLFWQRPPKTSLKVLLFPVIFP